MRVQWMADCHATFDDFEALCNGERQGMPAMSLACGEVMDLCGERLGEVQRGLST